MVTDVLPWLLVKVTLTVNFATAVVSSEKVLSMVSFSPPTYQPAKSQLARVVSGSKSRMGAPSSTVRVATVAPSETKVTVTCFTNQAYTTVSFWTAVVFSSRVPAPPGSVNQPRKA